MACSEIDVLRNEVTKIKDYAVEKTMPIGEDDCIADQDALFADLWGDDSEDSENNPLLQGSALSRSKQQNNELCSGPRNPFDEDSSEDEKDEDQRRAIGLRARVRELEHVNVKLSQAIERMEEEHGLHDEIAMFRERTNIIETEGETELPTATTYCIEGQRICTTGLDSPTGAERALLEEIETLKNQKQALCAKLEESRVKIAAGRD